MRTHILTLALVALAISIIIVPVYRLSLDPTVQAASVFSFAEVAPPTHLRIPSIGLDAPIEGVGLTQTGAMDVPSGASKSVGWYELGTIPGDEGTAVLDAHVFAAFSKLAKVVPGTTIYVTVGERTLTFLVQDVHTYALSDMTSQMLFSSGQGRHVNLITCAGTYVPALGTYNQRLVVRATLTS